MATMRIGVLFLSAALTVAIGGPVPAADVPTPPPASTYAPAQDLVAALDNYVELIAAGVANEEEYAYLQARVTKDADTVAALALVLGMHDEANRYKKAAPAIIKAANQVAAAADYSAAKAAFERLRTSLTAEGDPATLKWEKVASMKELMQQVPAIYSSLRRNLRSFDSHADEVATDAATIAALSQAAMPNVDETVQPNRAEQWFAFCLDMRDAAARLNKAARDGDADTALATLPDLGRACDNCHAVFHPEE